MRQVDFKNMAEIKKRKKSKRLSYEDKCTLVLGALERAYRHLAAMGVKVHDGFTMSHIAKMAGYQPSGAFMNDLFRMVDDGLLRSDTIDSSRNGLSPVEFHFFIYGRMRYAPKTKGMF